MNLYSLLLHYLRVGSAGHVEEKDIVLVFGGYIHTLYAIDLYSNEFRFQCHRWLMLMRLSLSLSFSFVCIFKPANFHTHIFYVMLS